MRQVLIAGTKRALRHLGLEVHRVRVNPDALVWPSATVKTTQQPHSNDLQKFFDSRKQGPGIWKWNHYFEIYDRHFRQFRGQEVHLLEIGVYSGGSLDMWRDYFGSKAVIYGVDIEPACRIYEKDGVKIFIGDQGDRSFWREFRRKVPTLDIVIDDGSHQSEHQIVSVEELLPFLRPGASIFAKMCMGRTICLHHMRTVWAIS